MKARSLRAVPKTAWLLLALTLSLQVVWQRHLSFQPLPLQALPAAPKPALIRLLSVGEPTATAKVLLLWLQSYDAQEGQVVAYRQFDYSRLIDWLTRILELDPRSQYPLLLASRVYAEITDQAKQRQMLEFVYQQFFIDPARRWQWLAHVATLAKHRLKDLPLALKYAKAISDHARLEMPVWAIEMQVFILEDLGEREQALLIIGGLLASGQITDPNEIAFLNEKLLALQQQ